MSEPLGLGGSDATAQWVGVRRHQAVFAILGLGLVGDWVLRPRARLVELVVGAMVALAAAPSVDGLSVAEWGEVVLRYGARSRWTSVSVDLIDEFAFVRARGDAMVRGFELEHRGRLDLSGRDVALANSLASLVDALASDEGSRHVSVHVRSSDVGVATLLALGEGTPAPEGWRTNNELVSKVSNLAGATSMPVLERWGYVRTPHDLVRVWRVSDFSAARRDVALLACLELAPVTTTVALHLDVVAASKAPRLAERAVHRQRSDGALAHATGFRRTARADRSLERVAQRESRVASGRGLARMAVYVSVHGSTLRELERASEVLLRSARESGLRCERGRGRHALWFAYQLPGGLRW